MHNITSPCADDSLVEAEIVAKGLTAPRVTPADIENAIADTFYFTAAQGVIGSEVAGLRELAPGKIISLSPDFPVTRSQIDLLTFCVLVLKNGFTVTGESACASPENFDAELGRKIARENAKQKLWPLLGYALKDRLAGAA